MDGAEIPLVYVRGGEHTSGFPEGIQRANTEPDVGDRFDLK